MAIELGYVLINPYSLLKSRTGGIISRLFARSQLELVEARMFAPSRTMMEEFTGAIEDVGAEKENKAQIRELFKRYLMENYIPNPLTNRKRRVMCLLFRGENAISRLKDVVGSVMPGAVAGETIRETYGDYILDVDKNVKYFEPAVFTGVSVAETNKQIDILSKYSDSDGGLLENIVDYGSKKNIQKTLVLIKPDNFRFPSGRPGNIIDAFSRTGLFIIGAKVLHMSVAQAEEFYGPVKEILREKLKGQVKARISECFKNAFPYPIPEDKTERLAEDLKDLNAEYNFNQIVNFMTGYDLSKPISDAEKSGPGKVRCLALVYQGQNAVEKIREQLGSTDPSKAAPATVRKEFGQNVMENTAHASDSAENALREMRIIGIESNNFKEIVKEYRA